MDIEISPTGPEREYVDQQIRSGRATSEGEILREALRSLMKREVDLRREYEEWREDARRTIDEAFDEPFEISVDGLSLLEELRLELEAPREPGSSASRFTSRADDDLRSLMTRLAVARGGNRAEEYRTEIARSIANMAECPEMASFREDLTDKPVRFWLAYSHLIVYRPDSNPTVIVRIVDGLFDPSEGRDRVGEAMTRDAVCARLMIEVPLDAREQAYLAARMRSEGTANAGDVLLGALRYLMDPAAEEQRAYDAWREETRHSIEVGYQECLEGETVDGEEFMEQLRHELEARRTNGS
ncbi:MAG: type II toxin-antitoxin system RelE/ParE family toxin [Planctomycetota bacterium]|nr:type II toxin-antitoxin system RelE/ParE family toxin [Planctomycetota bacterium]